MNSPLPLQTAFRIALLSSFLPAVPCSHAQTAWKATGSGDFLAAGNWTLGIPNSSVDASILNGTSGTPSVADLTFEIGSVRALTTGAFDSVAINNNAVLNVFGSKIINGGSLALAPAAFNSILGLETTTTLTGGGTLSLSVGTSGQAFIQEQAGGVTLDNKNNLIEGAGIIGNSGLAVSNEAAGIIDADASGQTLSINGLGGVTNKGLLKASNGGILALAAVTVANAGGSLTADNGTVNFGNTVVNGGTVNSLNGGVLQTAFTQNVTLNGVTLSSGSTLSVGQDSALLTSGTIKNQGSIDISAGSFDSVFGLNADTTLTGKGTVALRSGLGSALIEGEAPGLTLDNVNNLVQGAGTIGGGSLGLTNGAAGVVDANTSGQNLTVNANEGVTNKGLLEATNGGILVLKDVTIANAGGVIKASAGTVTLAGAVINGGTLTSLNGGVLQAAFAENATLNGVTLSSGSTLSAGQDTAFLVSGKIRNQGEIDLSAATFNAVFGLNANTTLTGKGTLTLGSGLGNAIVTEEAAGLTLDNVNNVIQGDGIIGQSDLKLINRAGGTILANSSSGALLINATGGFTNRGFVHVTTGATLKVPKSAYLQEAGMTVIDAGGTLDTSSVHEKGGTLQVDGTLDPLSVHVFSPATLSGEGTIDGNIVDDGLVILGDSKTSPGTLSENGTFDQMGDGTLIEGIGALDHGELSVTGDVNLDGSLHISLLGGFIPTNGELFELVGFTGSETGIFSAITGSDAPDWTVLHEAGQVDLEFNANTSHVADAAATPVLLLCGLFALAAWGPWLARRRLA